MNLIDYSNLSDAIYEFKTYMDETIIGIPFTDNISGSFRYFVIPPIKIREHNDSNFSIEQKIEKGILVQINPDVIDEYKQIK